MEPQPELETALPELNPEAQTDNFLQRNARDVLLLSLFILLALAGFFVQMAGPVTLVLANFMRLLEFAFALIIGTLIQLVISREQFLRERKRAALGAYRRILDIKRAVGRLRLTLEDLQPRAPVQSRKDFDIVSAIADGISDTVESSIGDWHDIIGPEMTTVNRISTLMSSLSTTHVVERHRATMLNIAQPRTEMLAEIERLRSALPPVLQSALEFEDEMLPREGRISFKVLRHFRESIRRNGFIQVPVRGNIRDQVEAEGAFPNAPFSYSLDYGMGHEWMTLSGAAGSGLVENPLEGEGVYEKDYQLTLRSVVPINEELLRHNPGAVEIVGSRFGGRADDADAFYVQIPITEDEFSEAVRRIELPMP